MFHFFHRWVEEQRDAKEDYDKDFSRDYSVTNFLLRCSVCGDVKSKTVQGYFPKS